MHHQLDRYTGTRAAAKTPVCTNAAALKLDNHSAYSMASPSAAANSTINVHLISLCIVGRYKRFTAWAQDVATRPEPKNPLAKKKRKKGEADSGSALVAAIRCHLTSCAGIACALYSYDPMIL